MTVTRRALLAASGATALGAIAGCKSLGSADDPESDDLPCPENPGSEPPTSDVYISAVVAAQQVSDDAGVNEESVMIETTENAPTDLTGYSLSYCGRELYEFPDLVSDTQPGADLQIYSGTGENGVDASAPPEYTLYVGSETELLANDGMRLAISGSEGEFIDAVA